MLVCSSSNGGDVSGIDMTPEIEITSFYEKWKSRGFSDDHIGKMLVELEEPEWSYWYARDVLHGRFPEGETEIASDAEWSYRYARDVLHARFPEGETAKGKPRRGNRDRL